MSFSEWKECELENVINFNPKESLKKGQVAKKIAMDKLDTFNKQIQGYEECEFKGGTKFRNGDTLLARITPCLENGKTAQVSILDKGEVGFGSTEFIVMREKENITCNDYIYYLSISPEFRSIAIKSMTGTSGRQRVQGDVLQRAKINLPPLQEQKAIANILSSLDEKIELNNQMNKTLEEMAQALFKRWFVDFEFPNENGEPYKSSGGEMVDSELGMIPKGWEVSTLSDLCSLETKSEKPFENKEVVYEHFSLPACDEGKLPVIEMGSEISSNKYKIDNECILISKLNPSTKRIWNPTCTTKNAICSTEFMVYKPKKVDDKDFCYEIINSDRFTEFLLANVTGSTGSRQRTQPKKTLEYKIALGDRLIITKFSNMIKPMHELVKNNIESNKVLRAKRDTLLPKLMSGEIRVTDLQS